MQNQIAVVGGCNIDISATSYTFLIEEDSNPGYVKTTLGGVGRNIAENLLLLGYPVSMITPLSRVPFSVRSSPVLSKSDWISPTAFILTTCPTPSISASIIPTAILRWLFPAWKSARS